MILAGTAPALAPAIEPAALVIWPGAGDYRVTAETDAQ